jgi:hypothetical protein
LATTRTVRDGLPGTLSAIASLESCFIWGNSSPNGLNSD